MTGTPTERIHRTRTYAWLFDLCHKTYAIANELNNEPAIYDIYDLIRKRLCDICYQDYPCLAIAELPLTMGYGKCIQCDQTSLAQTTDSCPACGAQDWYLLS